MKTSTYRYELSINALMDAYLAGKLGHSSRNGCAVTHVLGGKSDWMDVINPLAGTIDHENKVTNPKQFAKGLQQISRHHFTVEEIICLEASFSGRRKDLTGKFISNFDDTNDPDCTLGLSAVFESLSQWKSPLHSPPKPKEQVHV